MPGSPACVFVAHIYLSVRRISLPMKTPALLDRKGRILGRINVIDLIFVLALLVFLVFGGYYLFKVYVFFAPNPAGMNVVFRAYNLPYTVWSHLAEGDGLVDRNGDASSKIVKITVFKETSEGRRDLIISASMNAKKLTTGAYAFDNNLLSPGSGMLLRTDDAQFQAEVASVSNAPGEDMPFRKTTKTARLVLEGLDDWQVKSIRKGPADAIDGETVAYIKSKKVTPTRFVSATDDGRLRVMDNPLKSDVELVVELSAIEGGGSISYQGQPLRPGGSINLESNGFPFAAQIKSID